jgi:hypothetical protein
MARTFKGTASLPTKYGCAYILVVRNLIGRWWKRELYFIGMDMYKTMKPFHLHGTPLYYGKEYVI